MTPSPGPVGRDVILGPALLLGACAAAALAGPFVGERAVFGLDAAGAFGPVGGVAQLALVGVLVSARARGAMLAAAVAVGARIARRPVLADALAATALLAAFVALASQVPYGDGPMLIANTRHLRPVTWREPLDGLVHTTLDAVLAGLPAPLAPPDARAAYVLLAAPAGVLFVAEARALARRLGDDAADRALVAGAVIGSGVTSLFFGHVEAYGLAAAALASALAQGAAALATGVGVVGVAATLGLANALHPLTLAGTAVLPWLARRTRTPAATLAWLAPVLLTVAWMAARGRYPAEILGDDRPGGLDGEMLLPLRDVRWGPEGLVLLSTRHLADVANLAVQAAPALVPAVVVLACRRHTGGRLARPESVLLGVPSVVLLGHLLLWAPDLGLPRDWDLFVLLGLPASAWATWLAAGALSPSERAHAAVAWTLAAVGVTGPFVVANALGRVPG